jgi:hypothetical protein
MVVVRAYMPPLLSCAATPLRHRRAKSLLALRRGSNDFAAC